MDWLTLINILTFVGTVSLGLLALAHRVPYWAGFTAFGIQLSFMLYMFVRTR